MRALPVLAALLAAAPAFADATTGTVETFDSATGTLVMTDRTVWILGAGFAMAPGQTVALIYDTAGEDGLTAIRSVEVR